MVNKEHVDDRASRKPGDACCLGFEVVEEEALGRCLSSGSSLLRLGVGSLWFIELGEFSTYGEN